MEFCQTSRKELLGHVDGLLSGLVSWCSGKFVMVLFLF